MPCVILEIRQGSCGLAEKRKALGEHHEKNEQGCNGYNRIKTIQNAAVTRHQLAKVFYPILALDQGRRKVADLRNERGKSARNT